MTLAARLAPALTNQPTNLGPLPPPSTGPLGMNVTLPWHKLSRALQFMSLSLFITILLDIIFSIFRNLICSRHRH